MVEAVLMYRPHGVEQAVPIAATTDPRALRVVRDRVLEAAFDEVRFWSTKDAGVTAMKLGEAERLKSIFAVLLPDDELKPTLRLVKSDEEDPEP